MVRALFVFFCLCSFLFAGESQITLSSGAKALLYIPENITRDQKTPFIMALHGMGEYTRPTLKKWQPIAEKYGYILICPLGSNFQKGYSKTPMDDRQTFYHFKKYLDANYNIDTQKSLLVGFSRGGSFAIETGLRYPHAFPNVMSLFGYFHADNQQVLNRLSEQSETSRFYILTGLGDYSELSSSRGYQHLQSHKVPITLEVIDNLFHQYPNPFVTYFEKIHQWIHTP